jgi:ribA/ribD-fused uncharacterized protein
MATELERFYRAKAKAGIDGNYGYDNDGNLVERDGKGTVIKTITLPTYRRPTNEEYDVMEQTHREAIAVAERAVDEARSALYAMSQNPERDDSTMLRLNRAVMEEESKLVRIRFPLMYIAHLENIPIKQVDFTQPNNDRKVPYDLAILETRPFTLQEQYVRIGENPEVPLVSVAEAKDMIKAAEKEPVIVFEGTESDDYGYLSLDWSVMIEFHSTMYHSAKQAIYAELAKFFNDEVHLPQLLSAKTADEINYSLEDVPGENNADKWNEQLRKLVYDVNLEKFKQYPELAAKLLETKNAILGAYLPGDSIIGTGISMENVDAKDPSKWGENVLGKALMNIRDVMRESAAPPAEPAVAVPADTVPADAVPAAPSRKKRGKPSVGTFAPTEEAIPPIVLPSLEEPPMAQPVAEQPVAEQPVAEQPVAEQPAAQPPVAQGGKAKRTLRVNAQQKNKSPSS